MPLMPKSWPDTLYHYTSAQALLGILQSRKLWLSGRWNLNDSNEGVVFCERPREYATEKGSDEARVGAIVDRLSELESYVACFSAKRDLLSQWRGYANQGAGVCIGFEPNMLIELIRGGNECLLQQVTYSDKVAELRDETRSLLDALLISHGSPRSDFIQSAAKVMWTIKNRAFEEEDEYRLILTTSAESPIEFPSGARSALAHQAVDSGFREHHELSFGHHSGVIKCILLGPRNDSHVDVVGRLVRSLGLDVEIGRSKATFR
jgi:hypothetical protein